MIIAFSLPKPCQFLQFLLAKHELFVLLLISRNVDKSRSHGYTFSYDFVYGESIFEVKCLIGNGPNMAKIRHDGCKSDAKTSGCELVRERKGNKDGAYGFGDISFSENPFCPLSFSTGSRVGGERRQRQKVI